jgi:hypothetical protein
MRYTTAVNAIKRSKSGVMPKQRLAAMARCLEELARAGLALNASRLQPSSKGWRFKHSRGKRSVVDGPFAETKELIAG